MDSSRRALFLREMGLSPVWRLRGEDSAPGMPASEQPRIATGRIAAEVSAQVSAQPEVAQVPALMQDDRNARIMRMEWAELTAAVATCQACPLAKTRTNTVFGVGDQQADWLIVGEAPGAEEDARGEPFVGQAGRLLDNMFASVGLRRGDNVYIANVLKCRPPGNRNPNPSEVAQCAPHLQRQIDLIRPKLIIAMGRFAVQALLETDATIASLRGKLHRYQGVPLIVSYHPAYLLRSLTEKAKAWEDLCFARRTMAGL